MVADPEIAFLCFSGEATANNLSFSAPAIVCHHVGIPGSLVSFLHCLYVLVEAGPSQGFSSRGGQKPEGVAKNQKGGHIFKIQYWIYAATGWPKVKWGGTDFK